MKFYPVTNKDLMRQPKRRRRDTVYMALLEFMNSNYTFCRVEDPHYNNNNDLRRAIQSVIDTKNLPIHVFMKHGDTYVEKEI